MTNSNASTFFADKAVRKTTNENHCCFLSSIGRCVHPVTDSNSFINDISDDEKKEYGHKQKVEAYVFTKLEEYSREKSTILFRLTSFARVRRRLRRDAKHLSKQLEPYSVSEREIFEWIDETLNSINAQFPELRSSLNSQNEFKKLLLTDEFFSSNNNDNQWYQLKLKRAKLLFPEFTCNEKELLLFYHKHIMESLTPNKVDSGCLPLKNKNKIDLASEYSKAENTAQDYLQKLFTTYKKRKYPNLDLVKQMIYLGMQEMTKRPKTTDLNKASTSINILSKALFVLRSRNAYSMSLKNIADDFMVNLVKILLSFISVSK